ncbi:MAG: hypothetical protein K9M98_03750 [Cephaloticoccus sp.]|nr:hypothetical protein [Cephaloticoccus sp.]MCF7759596.1 hypothetical protein [Cephaloticoccus sp.]
MKRVTPRQVAVTVFTVTILLALGFALYTGHVWEDYYITFRSSRNLATGHGLVFNQGDRLHTFTSPLGVLLPALASLLTGNTSDTAALWVFRLMCSAALGGAVVLLNELVRQFHYPAIAAGFLVLYVATDAKSLDFTINGMETAFMLLFLAYAWWAHYTPRPRQWLHLGGAWAGLMWTRPDSFIYIGLIAAGVWLFNDATHTGYDRRQMLGLYIRAGLVTTLLYGPWLLWATWYYGSPVPHTIVAKGAQSAGGGARLLDGIWRMPWLIWEGRTAAEAAFLPSYYSFPSWPAWMLPLGRILATICSVLWLIPRLKPEVRAASLAYFGGAAYLSFVPYFPFPWYFPSTFLLAALILAGTIAQVWSDLRLWPRRAIGLGAGIILAASIVLTLQSARQVRAQQTYIETGNRKVIGEWLKAHAQPGDSVFMEPLGYIGYFSGLKTFDWPGMSSRELVDAKLLVGTNWGALIRYLQPNWLVLRPDGEGDLPKISPDLAASNYELVREFNRLDEVQQLDVPGRKLLEFDARFRVYHLIKGTRHDVAGMEIASPYGSSIRQIGAQQVRLVHAPGEMIVGVPAGRTEVSGYFGFPPDAYQGESPTDGATFRLFWSDGHDRLELFSRPLDPASRSADRNLLSYTVPLPSLKPGRQARLTFATKPGGNSTKDWTCWSAPEFH